MKHIVLLSLLFGICYASKNAAATTKAPRGSAPAPQFLMYASDTAKKEYVDIETNDNIVRATKAKALLAWATKNGEPILNAFNEYVESVKAQALARDQAADKIILLLSPSAQKADAALRGIAQDTSLTQKEADNQMDKLFKKQKWSVRKELLTAMEALNE